MTRVVFPSNLSDYNQFRSEFSWKEMENEFDRLPDDRGLNIVYEAVVRHAIGENANKIAIKWLGKKGEVSEFTYDRLNKESNRFANALKNLRIGKGQRVFLLSGGYHTCILRPWVHGRITPYSAHYFQRSVPNLYSVCKKTKKRTFSRGIEAIFWSFTYLFVRIAALRSQNDIFFLQTLYTKD